MSLRYKVLLILTAVVLAYVTADGTIQRVLVSRSFAELELAEAEKDLARAVDAIRVEEEALGAQCRRFAIGDDVWRFATGTNEPFRTRELPPTTLRDHDLDLLFVVRSDGGVSWSDVRDPDTDEPLRLRQFPTGSLSFANPFIKEAGFGDSALRTGLYSTERGPMVVASHRILSERRGGASGGWVIQGRFLGSERLAELGRRAHVELEVVSVDDFGDPTVRPGLKDEITGSPWPVAEPVDGGQLDLYTTLDDVDHRPELIARARIDRTISQQGERSVQAALLSSVATAILILLVLLRVLQTTVIQPLSQLTDTAVEIGKTDDVSLRIAMERTDEIGTLSDEFDAMMAKLQKSRAELVETARLAGMSEVATGVLHNVGNVLNSVNVSTNLVANRVEGLSVEDLEHMLAVLEEHEDDLAHFVSEDPRGKHFLPFLRELQEEFQQQKTSIRSELASLREGIHHIIDLVRSQQSYAGRAGVQEPVSLAAQLDAALSITAQSYAPEARIEIEREYEELPKVVIDRQKLLEVLVNLMQNARQSLDERGPEVKRIALRCRRDGDRVRLEVGDNGLGIDPEDLTRVFGHGFTTRADGHGFGLHISANAATEMGGRLWAESPGRGLGATFILELPLADTRKEAA